MKPIVPLQLFGYILLEGFRFISNCLSRSLASARAILSSLANCNLTLPSLQRFGYLLIEVFEIYVFVVRVDLSLQLVLISHQLLTLT